MYLDFDFEKMKELLTSFFKISNVRYSLVDPENRLLCSSSDFTGFCTRMNATEDGHFRCTQCDANAIQAVKAGKEGYLSYRCHAGLVEAVIPIRQHGDPIAFVFFGQMVSKEDLSAQWERSRAAIAWHPEADSFREDFMNLMQIDADMIDGCAKILEACSAYIWMEGVIRLASMSEEQQLNRFIAGHYMELLSLDTIARQLSMSKTKLCGIAAKQNTTVMHLLNNRRMEEAKRIFRHEKEQQVAEVAYRVGIRDYNHFSKLFKAYTGETPRAYQKRHHIEK